MPGLSRLLALYSCVSRHQTLEYTWHHLLSASCLACLQAAANDAHLAHCPLQEGLLWHTLREDQELALEPALLAPQHPGSPGAARGVSCPPRTTCHPKTHFPFASAVCTPLDRF